VRWYKNAFSFVAVMVSLPSLFLLVVGITNLSWIHIFFWGGMLLLWWGAHFYLRNRMRFAFSGTFVLVNVFWWPLFAMTILRINFVIENGGMERADGYGSPLAFLIGLIGEQIFFIPLSTALAAGIIVIYRSRRSQPENVDTSV
jgi:hypothetical protein